jgi:hypothetical protein
VRTVVWMSVALLLVVVFGAVAADISGKWVAQVPGRQGQTQEQTFTFKVSGGTLTGTISSQRGDQEISEGKVSGDEVSFVVVRKFQDMEMKSAYKGKIAGNEIKFSMTQAGGRGGDRPPTEFTAKKAGA